MNFRLSISAGLLLGACTLPSDEGRALRARVAALPGQPVAPLAYELGEPSVSEVLRGGRRYSWGQIYVSFGTGPSGECDLEVITDTEDRIVTADLQGSDYICGTMLTHLRGEARLDRADPGRRQRALEAISELARIRARAAAETNEAEPE